MKNALFAMVMFASLGFVSNANACIEGKTATFLEESNSGVPGRETKAVSVTRVCREGRYYPKAVTKGIGCRDGQKATFFENQALVPGQEPREVQVTRTCVNGSYYPKAPVKITQCREGRKQFFVEVVNKMTGAESFVTKVCTNGVYVTR